LVGNIASWDSTEDSSSKVIVVGGDMDFHEQENNELKRDSTHKNLRNQRPQSEGKDILGGPTNPIPTKSKN
jgi:hypothetical protein